MSSAADRDTLALVELPSYVSFLTVRRKVGAECSAADRATLALVELPSYVSFLTVRRKVGAECLVVCVFSDRATEQTRLYLRVCLLQLLEYVWMVAPM